MRSFRSSSADLTATGVSTTVTRSVAFAAVLAFASGATAVGAMAIYRLAIGQMAVQRLKINQLEIDELTVRRLNVLEKA